MTTSVLYERDGRIARITLNRPEALNAIDDEIPRALSDAVARADADPDVHVMLLSGAGRAFCAGYDLKRYASGPEGGGKGEYVGQEMPWDPIKDYAFMWANTQHFMSLWRALKPVVCKVHGLGARRRLRHRALRRPDADRRGRRDRLHARRGSGAAPRRPCGSTGWGPEKAKRLLFTGDRIAGREAAEMGLVLKAVPAEALDDDAEALARRMAGVPVNQLAMQKLVVNQAIEATGLMNTQRLATIFDGIARHSPEGLNFTKRAREVGWKQAVRERDGGTWDLDPGRADGDSGLTRGPVRPPAPRLRRTPLPPGGGFCARCRCAG